VTNTYKINDKVALYCSNHKGNLVEGKIVHVFSLYNREMYVVEIEIGIDPHYEVRDYFTLADNVGTVINMYKRKSNYEKSIT